MPGQEQGWGRGWERLGQGQGARAEERLAVAAQVPGRAGLSPACPILGTARSRRAAGALGASPARPGVCAAAGPGIRCPSERVCSHLKPDRWVWREWHCWGRGFLEVEQRDTVRWSGNNRDTAAGAGGESSPQRLRPARPLPDATGGLGRRAQHPPRRRADEGGLR